MTVIGCPRSSRERPRFRHPTRSVTGHNLGIDDEDESESFSTIGTGLRVPLFRTRGQTYLDPWTGKDFRRLLFIQTRTEGLVVLSKNRL